MKISPFVVAGAVVLLLGCATPAERAAQKQHEMEDTIQTYGPACERLGYRSNSDQWRDCILRLSVQDAMYQRYWAYPAMSTCLGANAFGQCAYW